MSFLSKIMDSLDRNLPKVKYSDGTNANCKIFRAACLLDPLDEK